MNIKKLKVLKALMLKIARRKNPGFDIYLVDCGTTACVHGWAFREKLCKNIDWRMPGAAMFLPGFGLTTRQADYICLPGEYPMRERKDPRAAARHIQEVIDGKFA